MSFENLPKDLQTPLLQLQSAARSHANCNDSIKKNILLDLAHLLVANSKDLLLQNKLDLDLLPKETLPAFRDRLLLNEERIGAMSQSLRQVAELSDPVNEVVETKVLDNGLKIKKVRAPLGVILMIFESRPNVITEAFSLAFKSGNAILLRGGSESKHSAKWLYDLIGKVFEKHNFPAMPFLGLQNYERKIVEDLLHCKEQIDIVVPRGGDALIQFVQKTALMPIIKNDRGMCHAYVAEDADMDMAVQIVANGKTQRPGVCNSLETVLVHQKIAEQFLKSLYEVTNQNHLIWHGDENSIKILVGKARVSSATKENWDTEYLDQIINSKVVGSMEEALEHIAKHGSKHSEVIITKDEAKAQVFMSSIDAAAVYWNASTRFTDGFEFGLGGELGISTQKLHVRGPVGLKELTSTRWLIYGHGQVRK